ncbi:MAG: IPT/TIG domain-containing protein, partial [Acidimicrobiales bacterium]
MPGKNAVVKVVLAALLSLVGLSVVGVGQAYGAAPLISAVTPATGTANGGTSVVIAGTGFGSAAADVTSVTFGGVPASYTWVSGVKVDATVPVATSSTAAVDVVVTVSGVNSTPKAAGDNVYTYTWTAAPTVTAVGQEAVTATSQVGSLVTVTAAGTWTAGQDVSLAGFVNNLTTGVVPVVTGGTGSFTINFAGTMNGGLPSNGVVSPTPAGAVGTTAGGTSVVIIGTNLGGPSAVHFGSTAATSFTVVSA